MQPDQSTLCAHGLAADARHHEANAISIAQITQLRGSEMNDTTEIDNLTQSWVASFKQKDAKACASLWTEDAWLLSSYGDQVRGRDSIEKTMQEWIDSEEKNKKTKLLEISIDNELAYTVVAYSGDFEKEDGSLETETGKVVNVYKRQPDGKWKYHIGVLTSDNPPSA